MRILPAVLLVFVISRIAPGQVYTITTFAGGGLPVNIAGTSASLYGPQSVAVDKGGNIFFTDHNDVLRLDAMTGLLTLVAGNGTTGFSGDNGAATNSQLNSPSALSVDSSGNIYIADSNNNRIRKVSNGVITTVAGGGSTGLGDNGPATGAQLNFPRGVAVDAVGNLYIADFFNGRVRKVANGVITTFAGGGSTSVLTGSGPATNAELAGPIAVTVDSAGNVFIADYYSIREVSAGMIATVAGDGTPGSGGGDNGPATSAQLNQPWSLAVDSVGNVYIADPVYNRIRKVSKGIITTVVGNAMGGFAGDNGPATAAQLKSPYGLSVDAAGNLYIGDSGNSRIREVSNGVIATVGGGGVASIGDNKSAAGAQLKYPEGVTVDAAGDVYVADTDSNRIRKVVNGVIVSVAGNGTSGFGGDNGPATSAQLNGPSGVTTDSAGNLYIADFYNQRVRKVANGVITTVAGGGTGLGDNGPATSAALNYTGGVAVDSAGNLYIADTYNNRVRKVTNGVISTVAGNGMQGFGGDNGPSVSAQLNTPQSIAVDSLGTLYIADTNNHRVREVFNGVITTVVGDGIAGFGGDGGPAASAQLYLPWGITVDTAGDLFISDEAGDSVRKVSNGVITTVAGSAQGFSGDNGPATSAQLYSASGVAADPSGNVYFSDEANNRIRLLTLGLKPAITPGGIVPIYSSSSVIQPGSWVSIYGTDLASGTAVWNNDFPQSLGGTTVTVDNKPTFLWVVSPTQINLQVPDDATTGLVSVVVNTASGTATSTVTLAPSGPSFSLLGDGKHVAAEILTTNGTGAYGSGTYDLVGPANTFSYSTRPVKAGEILVLYGVGFGPTTPSVLAGKVFSGSAPTNNKVAITIGGVAANVSYSGITSAGLYQINLTVPSAPSGDQALQATVNGVQTPLGPVVTVQ